MDESLIEIAGQTRAAVNGLLAAAALKPGHILVIGCSTSEVLGRRIGTASSMEAAGVILEEILTAARAARVFPAIQCCEHLNRALVVELVAAEKYQLEEVAVVPAPGAGGALAAAAMDRIIAPVVVERIAAHAGMDIGDTFIGMHLRQVVVPVRLEVARIGQAHLTLARTRPKLIGGERAKYCR